MYDLCGFLCRFISRKESPCFLNYDVHDVLVGVIAAISGKDKLYQLCQLFFRQEFRGAGFGICVMVLVFIKYFQGAFQKVFFLYRQPRFKVGLIFVRQVLPQEFPCSPEVFGMGRNGIGFLRPDVSAGPVSTGETDIGYIRSK